MNKPMWADNRCFKVYQYKFFGFEETKNIVLDAITVLQNPEVTLGQRQAAKLLLKAFLTSNFYKSVMADILPKTSVIDRNDPRVRRWSKEVVSRGACENCGATEDLQAHHVKHWSLFPEKRIDVNNGACLCRDCHALEHRFENCYYMIKNGHRKLVM